jgi:hypothetical protein
MLLEVVELHRRGSGDHGEMLGRQPNSVVISSISP